MKKFLVIALKELFSIEERLNLKLVHTKSLIKNFKKLNKKILVKI